MKQLLPILFCIAVALHCHAQDKVGQNASYSPVETIITDLNADAENDTLQLYELPVAGDPGSFRKMNISLSGFRRMTYNAKYAWDIVNRDFAKASTNAVDSKMAFIHKEKEQSYIFLFGHAYPTGMDEFFILQVQGRRMDIVFHNTIGEPQLVADLNGDGDAELITRTPPEIARTSNKGDIGAYSPFIVYSLSPFGIDKTLTEKYNRDHYLWAGIKYNDAIEVLYPKDGSKPKLN